MQSSPLCSPFSSWLFFYFSWRPWSLGGLFLGRSGMATLLIVDDEASILLAFRKAFREPAVTFITGKSTTDSAIESMKLGAYEYLLKPLELSTLRQVIDRALAISRLMHVPAVLAAADDVDERADAIVGVCPAMQDVYKAIGRVAAQDVTVLISGESGTGKELVARAL